MTLPASLRSIPKTAASLPVRLRLPSRSAPSRRIPDGSVPGVPAVLRACGRLIRTGLILLAPLWPLKAYPPSIQKDLRVGLSSQAFPDLNRADAEASFKVVVGLLARKKGHDLQPVVHWFDSPSEFETAMRSGEIHLAVLGPWDYLNMNLDEAMEPAFVHAMQDRVTVEYLLLVRKDSGVHSLRDLRGQSITLLKSASCQLAPLWLETLLSDDKLGSMKDFFRSQDIAYKATASVLPVFFRKSIACVVDRASFQLMAEMNPQLGSELQALATSPSFLSSILCVSRKGWASDEIRANLIATLANLHNEPEGRQILLMFKIDRLVPYQEGYLSSLKDLRSKQRNSKARIGK